MEVNSIRVCQIKEAPVLSQHDVFPKSIDSSKSHTCSSVSSVEEGTNFQDNNSKVVSRCHVAQRFEDNSAALEESGEAKLQEKKGTSNKKHQ